jgi:DNA mismatch repair protein MutS2
MAQIDLIFAKARYAEFLHAVCPVLTNDRTARLVAARHPLIDPKKVVPVDVSVGRDVSAAASAVPPSVLLISGPNTGGKTVTLKTIGLFTLMAMTGLFVPAGEGSALSVFENLFCDIGDEQSIALSLSTFSSHITNIAHILRHIEDNALVLLDELGAGTDPDEGAALAIGVIDYLLAKGARAVVTTHYSRLKAHYLDNPAVHSASMEFDRKTLKPTYRVLMGIAGASNALTIAAGLGIPAAVIATADANLSDDKKRFEALLGEAESRRMEAESLRRGMEADRKTLDEDLAAAREERDKLFSLRQTLQQNLKVETRKLAQHAAEEAQALIDEMKEKLAAEASEGNLLRLKQLRNRLDGLGQSDADAKPFVEAPLAPGDIMMGMEVFVESAGKSGKILSLPTKRGEVSVSLGNVTLLLPVSDLSRAKPREGKPKPTGGASYLKSAPAGAVAGGLEINLLGQTLAEATANVEAFLDGAVLSGIKTVRIIHGMGTGVLRAGLHKYFKTCKYIADYRLGGHGEGSTGVTIVTLK